jgi:hypothetical protein
MADRVADDMAHLEVNDWLASGECMALNAKAQLLLQKDALSPEEVDTIDAQVPKQHKELFWERLTIYFDEM